jgi:hypothetical protein
MTSEHEGYDSWSPERGYQQGRRNGHPDLRPVGSPDSSSPPHGVPATI